MGTVHGVGPLASDVYAERTVAAGAVDIGLRHKHWFGTVCIADSQLTGSGQCSIGFKQACRVGSADHRHIFGASDVDCHHFDGTVSAGGVEAVGIGFTGHELVVRCVHGVGPLTHSIDAELAVTAAAVDIALCSKARSVVHIHRTQHTSGGLNGIGFDQIGRAHSADHSSIVSACDVHRNFSAGRTVHTGDSDDVTDLLSGFQLVMRTVTGVRP